MKALITGSAGAVGVHMVQELQARGWDVDCMDIVFGRDCLSKFRDFDAPQYDLVVHLAALIGGRKGIDGVNLNLPYDLQLDAEAIQWAVRTKQRHFLAFSSSAAYPTYLQTKESHKRLCEEDLSLEINQPDAGYGLTKWVLEREIKLARENGLKCTVVRPFSGYSEKSQSLDYPFPSIIDRAKRGALLVWGPPGQTRDFIHLEDVVKGALAVAESGDERAVNICTGIGTELGYLMTMAGEQVTGYLPVNVAYDETKPTGVFHRVGDPTRMHEHYKPTITIEEGIQRALKGGERL